MDKVRLTCVPIIKASVLRFTLYLSEYFVIALNNLIKRFYNSDKTIFKTSKIPAIPRSIKGSISAVYLLVSLSS